MSHRSKACGKKLVRNRNGISNAIAAIIVIVIVVIAAGAYFALGASVSPRTTTVISTTVMSTSNTSGSGTRLKIAYIASGPCNDFGYYQAGCDAVKNMTNIAQVSETDNVADANYLSVAKQYADQGYNIIFGQGYQAIAPFSQLAPQYPNVLFGAASLGFTSNSSNFVAYTADTSASAYLVGVIGALMSKSHHLGFVSGVGTGSTWELENAYKLGVWSINKTYAVTPIYTGDFNDPNKALQAGNSLVQQGVDYIFVFESPGGTGTFQVCQSAKIFCAGQQFDENSLAPQSIVTSAEGFWSPVMLSMVKDYQSHQVKTAYICTMVEGCADIAPFHGLVPSTIASQVMTVRSQILSGQIIVPQIVDHEITAPP